MNAPADEILAEVKEFVDRCLELSRLQADCECSLVEDNTVKVALKGEDRDLMLRENARLLYAVNHLVNQAFFRRYRREYNYMVDCAGYRETRTMELQLLARKAAEQVRSSRRSFRLQPMPASERRTIHLTLAEEDGVRTESQGSGRHRRVIIEPD